MNEGSPSIRPQRYEIRFIAGEPTIRYAATADIKDKEVYTVTSLGAEKELLDQLLAYSDRHFGRVDTYLADMRRFLSDTSEWRPQHDAVFDEMIRSVRVGRRLGVAAAIVAILLVLALLFYAWIVVPGQKRQLAEDLRRANLEIEFEQRDSDLLVKYVSSSEDPDRNRLLRDAGLYDVPIGRYSGGLGSAAVLRFVKPQSEEMTAGTGTTENEVSVAENRAAWRWDVAPQSRDSIIGTLTVANTSGSIPQRQVFFDEPVPYQNLSELNLMIDSVIPDSQWISFENSDDRSALYQVTFGVRPDADSDLVWSASVAVPYSGEGHMEEGPFLVSAPGWPNAYVVNVAIGYWGEAGNRKAANFVRSEAYRISFNPTN